MLSRIATPGLAGTGTGGCSRGGRGGWGGVNNMLGMTGRILACFEAEQPAASNPQKSADSLIIPDYLQGVSCTVLSRSRITRNLNLSLYIAIFVTYCRTDLRLFFILNISCAFSDQASIVAIE